MVQGGGEKDEIADAVAELSHDEGDVDNVLEWFAADGEGDVAVGGGWRGGVGGGRGRGWRGVGGVFDADEENAAVFGEKGYDEEGGDGAGETGFGEGVGDVHKVEADEGLEHVGYVSEEVIEGGVGGGGGGREGWWGGWWGG